MEFDYQLLVLLIWYPALDIRHVRHTELPTGQLHPRVPSVVARSAQRMVGVPTTRADIDTSTRQRLHGAQAHMGLLATVQTHVLRDQSNQRTGSTAVGLLGWELYLNNVSLRHFVFRLSGNRSLLGCSLNTGWRCSLLLVPILLGKREIRIDPY